MFCRKCGSEIRSDARFCNRCGVPIPNRPGQGEYNRRQTIDLPRDETPLRNTGFKPAQGPTDRLPPPPLKAPPVPPVNRRPKKPDLEPRRAGARTQNDLPSLMKPARSNTVIRNQLATTPISLPSPPMREPEAKPFFTQALTADKNPQHKRLVTVVPLLLLVVILLFVFAYIAGR
jgi:zinc ribbon protein